MKKEGYMIQATGGLGVFNVGPHSSLQGHAIPSVISVDLMSSEKQNSKAKAVLSLYLHLFFQTHRHK